MPTLEEEEAFSHLRARQGAGARYDADSAPAHDLLLARRGTAHFARLLHNLRDAELYKPSTVRGWTRGHVVAAVAFNARDLTRIVEAVRVGHGTIEIPSENDREDEIAYVATLPAHALRNLFKHSEVHLNVEWRDLTNEHWKAALTAVNTSDIPVAATPLMRARFIWVHAIDLNAGGDLRNVPPEFRKRV